MEENVYKDGVKNMVTHQAYFESEKIQKMYDEWTKKGLSEEKKKVLLFAYLDERKRKILKLENVF